MSAVLARTSLLINRVKEGHNYLDPRKPWIVMGVSINVLCDRQADVGDPILRRPGDAVLELPIWMKRENQN